MKSGRVGREFLVEVATLRKVPGSSRPVVIDSVIEDLAIEFSKVPEGAPIHLDVVLESVSGGIMVRGEIRAPWVGECRRCLEEAHGELVVELAELAEIEPVDEELTYRLAHDELDLRPIAHDACILELPLAPLCREGCLGLCPTCGVNRNFESCSCREVRDGRFDALSALQRTDEDANSTQPN